MIAAMTAVYGLGQIAGPLAAGALYASTGSFSLSLTAAAVSLIAAGIIIAVETSHKNPVEENTL